MMRITFSILVGLLAAAPFAACALASELRFCIRSDPKTFNPLLASDDASETFRYLTAGVLIRLDRATQLPRPELAESWRISDRGRRIDFRLRGGVRFSDGTPFTSDDVVFTLKQMSDPGLLSPVGDTFRAGGSVQVSAPAPDRVSIVFSSPVAGLERLFDSLGILSARSPRRETAVLGPFTLAEHKAGAYLLLRRNPHYWKKDSQGRSLPYLDAVRLLIQQNREAELLRFRRGEIHVINELDPEMIDRLSGAPDVAALDKGPSLDAEVLWFNQVPSSPVESYKRAWFESQAFRRAVSAAIDRDSLCRIAYKSHAQPAAGPVSRGNSVWCNRSLAPHAHDPAAAAAALRKAGFRLKNGVLYDSAGHPVEFSLLINAGNKPRERMAALIQQDLKAIGVNLRIAAMDFGSVIERITRTKNYEACLLGFVNTDLDPNGTMNIWLSSASNHAWYPNQKTPATLWEAGIDRLVTSQATERDRRKRKAAFDAVQRIVWEQAPMLFLVNRNSVSAVSLKIKGISPVPVRPQTYWNIETLSFRDETM